jgi:archaeosine synthase beta-subunit
MPDAAVARFPATAAARDRFVLARRGPRTPRDPWHAHGVIVEDERAADGHPMSIATLLLTGRECPWRCTMCDLWRDTIETDTPRGAIPAQIAAALTAVRAGGTPVAGIKLYNSGSFFDPRAVPESDYGDIVSALTGLSHVIVESHPALVGARLDRWLAALARQSGGRVPQLEVAMGLETAHPESLDRLNKRFTLVNFADAARTLADREVALRVFLLISPPFVPTAEQDDWLLRSVDAAFACGATVVSLVPTRSGNGALDDLAESGWFRPPDLDDIERSFATALTHANGRGRVFVDVWDLERFAPCAHCVAARRDRLVAMNLAQRVLPPIACHACHGDAASPRGDIGTRGR